MRDTHRLDDHSVCHVVGLGIEDDSQGGRDQGIGDRVPGAVGLSVVPRPHVDVSTGWPELVAGRRWS